ncbi:MAG: hypothetical protein K940chlam7_00742 [Chlamydiae bacterium]|nr:hypothetical protein [Chlamydiota bacterium]
MASSPVSPESHLIGNLSVATSDVYYATHGGLFKPNYHELLIDLHFLRGKDVMLPRSYQTSILTPFINFLENNEGLFNKLFHESEEKLNLKEGYLKRGLREVAEGLLQRNHELKYYRSAFRDLNALQAVVTTIFQDVWASDISPRTSKVLPPLAKWGYKSPHAFPPFSFPFTEMKIPVGIVNFPAEYRKGGLLAWVSLGHEVAGHHFLRYIDGLVSDLRSVVADAFKNKEKDPLVKDLGDYWCACVEETVCDVLGVLNTGPSFGIGLLGYLRAVRGGQLKSSGTKFSTEKGSSMNSLLLHSKKTNQIFVKTLSDSVILEGTEGLFGYLGPENSHPLKYQKYKSSDKHPVDILRFFVITSVISILDSSSCWIKLIEDEVSKDLGIKNQITLMQLNEKSHPIVINSIDIPIEVAKRSVQVVVEALMSSPLKHLEGKKLTDIFSWTEKDEILVEKIKEIINDPKFEKLPDLASTKSIARHVIAASVLSSVQQRDEVEGTNPIHAVETIFHNMKTSLVDIFERDPTWHQNQHMRTVYHPPSEIEDDDE